MCYPKITKSASNYITGLSTPHRYATRLNKALEALWDTADPHPDQPPPGNINYGATTYCPVTSSIDAIRDPAPRYTPVMRPSSFTSSVLGVPGRPGMVDTAPETG